MDVRVEVPERFPRFVADIVTLAPLPYALGYLLVTSLKYESETLADAAVRRLPVELTDKHT